MTFQMQEVQTTWGRVTSAWFRVMNPGRDCEAVVVEWTGAKGDGEYDHYFYSAALRGQLADLARLFLSKQCSLGVVADRMMECPEEMDQYGLGLPADEVAEYLIRTGRTRLGDM